MQSEADKYLQAPPIEESPDIYRKGKTVYAADKPLKTIPLLDVKGNIVIMRQPHQSFFAPAGFTLVYFMANEEAAKAMGEGKIPYLMVPVGTRMGGGNPINDVWKRRFAKPGTGQEHILGLIQAISNEKLIYIDMMSVRAPYRRNSITQKMIDTIRASYPNAEVRFSDPTDDGRKFIKKFTGKDPESSVGAPPPEEELVPKVAPLKTNESWRDWMAAGLIAGSALTSDGAPPSKPVSGQKPKTEQYSRSKAGYEKFIKALHMQEASGRMNPPDGDNGKAIGPFQIWEEYWMDAVDFDPSIGGKYENCRDYNYARKVVDAYLRRYGKKFIEQGNWEALARIHNGGPIGYKKASTLGYWRSMKRHIR